MKYQINEEQQAKIDSLLNQLDEEGKTLLQDKIERLLSFDNAEVRLNKLLEKTIVEIKKLISVEKSRNKKKNNVNKEVQVTEEIKVLTKNEILSQILMLDYPDIISLMNEVKFDKEKVKEKYLQKLDEEIKKVENELMILKQERKEIASDWGDTSNN